MIEPLGFRTVRTKIYVSQIFWHFIGQLVEILYHLQSLKNIAWKNDFDKNRLINEMKLKAT